MINAPRGTQDILSAQSKLWSLIEKTAEKIFAQAGFNEIRTPIFEDTNLFLRAVGEASDIVNKEMYTFLDKSERSLTLRPEGTAGVVRAFIENHLEHTGKPIKLWYRGPMFRYERPQTGRYRQFHQIGLEAIGSASPHIDLEVINSGMQLLDSLKLTNLTLYINSLGNKNSRTNYINALQQFLFAIKDKVCDDCKRRMEVNPLRCLDCKVEHDQNLYKQAPKIHEFYDEESKNIFEIIKSGLEKLSIKYHVDENLVRGLDYYDHCVFEIKCDSDVLGAQSTVLGGGRYDKLIEDLGGNPNPAVGFALGLERLALLIGENQLAEEKKTFIISDDSSEALLLAKKLRNELDLNVEFDYENSKFKKQLEKALKRNFDQVIFFLESERRAGTFGLKKLKSNQEFKELDFKRLCELLLE